MLLSGSEPTGDSSDMFRKSSQTKLTEQAERNRTLSDSGEGSLAML